MPVAKKQAAHKKSPHPSSNPPDSLPLSRSYPQPGPVGGRLIRELVSFLRKAGLELPIDSHILIAVSGGPDSIALAHLLLKYGRRVVDSQKLILLHVNHQWRAGKSKKDAQFVKSFAQGFKAKLVTKTLPKPQASGFYEGRSWEDAARDARKGFFEKQAQCHKGLVFTAHQADDLAETLLWRLLTGASGTHGGGIAVRHGLEVRPLLRIRKKRLLQYLKEEKQTYCEDETNLEGRFLRSRIRTEIMPAVEPIFPRAVEHLVQLALDAQTRSDHVLEVGHVESLLSAAGIRCRRPHWEAIQKGSSEVHLPGGWKLTREIRKKNAAQQAQECWRLERAI